MPNDDLPLLIFPDRTLAARDQPRGGGPDISFPGFSRQQQRLTPQFEELARAMEARRLEIDAGAPLQNPELVLVFEVIGTVKDFFKAVARIPGLEWLFDIAAEDIAPDDDFHFEDPEDRNKALSGCVYLLGTNQEALQQLLSLWNRYKQDHAMRFPSGYAPFKHLFEQLKNIRPWDHTDRVGSDVRTFWQDAVHAGDDSVRFEVEAWYFSAAQKNELARREISDAVQGLGGRVLKSALIGEIAYHGFLVEIPAEGIRAILNGEIPQLLLSDRIMFFRPKAQSVCDAPGETEVDGSSVAEGDSFLPPIVALLDGLPMANHDLLQGRLEVEDPDGWGNTYEVKDRVHGTAMASLILHGELLDAPSRTSPHRLYVRPIMRPDPADARNPRQELTPNDVLLIDLMHRAVKRMCEGENGQAPTAPTVRVINLSVGLIEREFGRDMSPWARLLDWLAHRYSVLFIVSAGNHAVPVDLRIPRDDIGGLPQAERQRKALESLISDSANRRLLSPGEAINALTIGAHHSDGSQPQIPASRFDLFAQNGVSPVSRIGLGYRRAIKPDVLMPGGRILFSQNYAVGAERCVMNPLAVRAAPGHRTAAPPAGGESTDATAYCRGTSNATALASRMASEIYEVLASLRRDNLDSLPPDYDAVLLKALLVHGALWGDLPEALLANGPSFDHIEHGATRQKAKQDFVSRWIGYGAVDAQRSLACAPHRATLLGVGEVSDGEALVFSAPLPPSLSGVLEWRRITLTLAWLSPIRPSDQRYRAAKLWVQPPSNTFHVYRVNTVDHRAAQRGTLQHEVFEGQDEAMAFVDGDRFVCKVNCKEDAGKFEQKIRFALCVSIEVGIGSAINVYDEIRDRIEPEPPRITIRG